VPRIFDNIDLPLAPALRETLESSYRGDFAVGYFNLRGWAQIDDLIDKWSGGEDQRARVLVGMERLPADELKEALSFLPEQGGIDNHRANQLKQEMAQQFRNQLTFGAPTESDERTLRRLSTQLKARKVVVKLYLRHSLHAKLYLLHRHDLVAPAIAYTGSSNLTLAGLVKQGELNVDVLDHDACAKLQRWFDDRWNDRYSLDITDELAEIIDESWARAIQPPPYLIYLKIAYHLSREARAGVNEFQIPSDFQGKLLPFQSAAVRIAAHHLNKRHGVLIGDVVGLGKTLMAAALARVFEDDRGTDTLIISPKHLVEMWEAYVADYRLRAKVLSLGKVDDLRDMRRYRVVLIDESQNLRNREGKRYKLIQDYIDRNDCYCIMLSATPYNKTYLDLSSQLRLFVPDDQDLGIRPERLLREIGETEFIRRHQAPVRSLAAFEKSEFPDDWRDLMRLYLVRRTRSFIKANYAETDGDGRLFLKFENGERFYFPEREPRTLKFTIDDKDPNDPYARLYSQANVNAVNRLSLPRYGLGNYIRPTPSQPPTPKEDAILRGLSRAGQRLMGFSRTNLFKRLESGGPAFLQSIERHALRNFVYLHAIKNGLDLPIGIQAAEVLDADVGDRDLELLAATDDTDPDAAQPSIGVGKLRSAADYDKRASDVYVRYSTEFKSRFRWIRSALFVDDLARDLTTDVGTLLKILERCGDWEPSRDTKLDRLEKLVTQDHRGEKVLVFTQFADTADYLFRQLKHRNVSEVEVVTGDSDNPTHIAWRFSPKSNRKTAIVSPSNEIRVLVATDVLSEGQNLQDCAIVVNYDLPWAIVRLIQRAGRVDRIGQVSPTIWCYSFLPADGVERIIRLRARVKHRLGEQASVVGSDERFFEDDITEKQLADLYNEKAAILEDQDDGGETDLASQAFEIWNQAIKNNPELKSTVENLPDVVYSTKSWQAEEGKPAGVLVYARIGEDTDALVWVDQDGNNVTESQLTILRAAESSIEEAPAPRLANHHELVRVGVEAIVKVERSTGGQLGRPSGARFKTYTRLKRYCEDMRGTLFYGEAERLAEKIYNQPLRQVATDVLNRQLRAGISDEQLVALCGELDTEGRLCAADTDVVTPEPQIICSMGLRQ
jgi:superfamily II DNA or RNA helicase